MEDKEISETETSFVLRELLPVTKLHHGCHYSLANTSIIMKFVSYCSARITSVNR